MRPLRTIRNLGVFAANLAGLTTGAAHDTRDYIDESLAWKILLLAIFRCLPTGECKV